MVVTNKAEKERFSVFRLYMFAGRRLTLLDPTSVVLSGVFGVSGGWAEKVICAGRAVFEYFFVLRVENVVFSSSFFGFLPEKPVFPKRKLLDLGLGLGRANRAAVCSLNDLNRSNMSSPSSSLAPALPSRSLFILRILPPPFPIFYYYKRVLKMLL